MCGRLQTHCLNPLRALRDPSSSAVRPAADAQSPPILPRCASSGEMPLVAFDAAVTVKSNRRISDGSRRNVVVCSPPSRPLMGRHDWRRIRWAISGRQSQELQPRPRAVLGRRSVAMGRGAGAMHRHHRPALRPVRRSRAGARAGLARPDRSGRYGGLGRQ